MFKRVVPKKVSTDTKFSFPHCDQRVLHAPGECRDCDEHSSWQELRQYWGIAYTNYEPEGTELPCPSNYARGDAVNKWHGNKAVKL